MSSQSFICLIFKATPVSRDDKVCFENYFFFCPNNSEG